MAITHIAKIFETENTSDPISLAVTTAARAGSLLVVGYGGKRSGAYLKLSGISDTKGNVWTLPTPIQSEFRACGLAYSRIGTPLTSSDLVTLNWNGSPSYIWVTGHIFEGAAGETVDESRDFATGTSITRTVGVSGSDWLTVATLILPYGYNTTITPVNSSLSRDTNGNTTEAPWCEFFSRNGTAGTTHTIGGTVSASHAYAICALSFAYQAIPSSAPRVQGAIGGAV